MEKVVHDMLKPLVRSFIEDRGFALFQKLGSWLEAKIPSVAARVVIGLLLGLTAIASVVTVRALAGF
jgi:site-specific recombinase